MLIHSLTKPFVKKSFFFFFRFNYFFSALFVLLAVLAMWAIPQVKMDNDHWLKPSDSIEKSYLEFQNTFSEHPQMAIIVTSPDLFQKELLEKLKIFKKEIKNLPHIKNVVTPLDMVIFQGNRQNLNISNFEALLDQKGWDKAPQLASQVKNLFYAPKLISKDNQHFIVLISFPKELTRDQKWIALRKKTIPQIQKKAQEIFKPLKLQYIGEQYMKYQTDIKSQRNLIISLSTLLIFAILILTLFFKRLLLIVVPLATALLSVSTVFVLMVLFNQPLTIISVSLPALVFVTSLCDSIHICLRYVQLRLRTDLFMSLKRTYQEKWLPSFFTAFTTALGCGSFISSQIVPLKSYSLIGFIALTLVFFIMLHLSILLIYFFDRFFSVDENKAILKPQTFFKKLDENATRWPKRTLGLHLAIVLLMLIPISKLSTETSFIESFFKKSDPIRKSYEFYDKHFGGSSQYEIILQGNEADFTLPQNLETIQKIKSTLQTLPAFTDAIAFTDWLKALHQALHPNTKETLPQKNNQIAQELLLYELSYEESKPDVIGNYLSYDQSTARIKAGFNQQNSHAIEKTLKNIKAQIEKITSFNVTISGSEPRYHVLSQYLLNTQIQSIFFSFLTIYLCFLIPFGFRLATLGMLPNLFPLFVVYGIMGLLHVPIDFATILIEALVLGVVVDDTLHFLFHYLHIKTTHVREHTALTAQSVGMGTAMMSLILLSAFLIFAFSDLLILSRFGLFASLGMLAGFWADLVLLPNLLIAFDRKTKA